MSQKKPKPAAVLSSGSVSIEFDGKTYTGSYVVRDDATVDVHCRHGHRRGVRTLQGAPGRVEPQDTLIEHLLKEIIGEAARNGRLDLQSEEMRTDQMGVEASAARPKMNPVSKQRGKSYYAIRCGNCQDYLPLVEIAPSSSDERATKARLEGFIVRCSKCVHETLVGGSLTFLEIR